MASGYSYRDLLYPVNSPVCPITGDTQFEETVSALTHGGGLILSLLAVISMLSACWEMDSIAHFWSLAVYGLAWVFLYLSSTVYHLVRRPSRKSLLRKVDHSAIFLVMAATYTPFLVLGLNDLLGWSVLTVVWVFALGGIAFKFLSRNPYGLHSVATYMVLGWMAVVILKPLTGVLDLFSVALLLLGGVLYNIGIPFYLRDRLRFNHAIWHIFVISASACHHFVILRSFVW